MHGLPFPAASAHAESTGMQPWIGEAAGQPSRGILLYAALDSAALIPEEMSARHCEAMYKCALIGNLDSILIQSNQHKLLFMSI
jgi:hypothetical protein